MRGVVEIVPNGFVNQRRADCPLLPESPDSRPHGKTLSLLGVFAIDDEEYLWPWTSDISPLNTFSSGVGNSDESAALRRTRREGVSDRPVRTLL